MFKFCIVRINTKKKADIEKYDITEKKKSVHYSVTKHYIYVLDSLEILEDNEMLQKMI